MSDYISREALLSATEGYDWQAGLKTVLKRIPAADVRPVVRGRWIWKDNGEVVCSECNDLVAVVGNTEDLEMVISGFNFCPNCGADMRAEPPKEDHDA